MRASLWCCLLLASTALSGCLGEEGSPTTDVPAAPEPEAAVPHIIEWNGHITHSALDMFAHMKDPEKIVWPVQQAGFLVEIDEMPEAIEVMVSWEGNAGFYLHPHYTAESDPAIGGDTLYYGYFSELFTSSPGCIRIPQADMAAGEWPMMIHPQRGTMDVDYTITVGILGAEGKVPPDMHGHRTDGDSPVEDHGIEECVFLPGL